MFVCVLAVLSASGLAQKPPATSDHPWEPSARTASEQSSAAALDARTQVDSNHTYTLPELIDLAEKHNPSTRAAWENARSAAGQVGVARSDLLPALTAEP